MSQDSIANAFGVLDILSLPVGTQESQAYDHDYGKAEIEELGKHFGNLLWVLKSRPDSTSENGFRVQPELINALLDKDELMGEFRGAWGGIYLRYKEVVKRVDVLTRRYGERGDKDGARDDDDEGEPRLTEEDEKYSQKYAYRDWVNRRADDYPNLSILVRLMLAHIPNSVDPERNASNLKQTLTKQRNRVEYDSLNAEMQATENGPLNGSLECEKMLGKVGDHIMKGTYVYYVRNCYCYCSSYPHPILL